MSDERETLRRELEAARARIARLEQESETNRAFFARSLSQAHEGPRPAGGVTVWHALALILGLGLGVFVTLLMLVLRGEPPPMAPLPPPRKTAVLPVVAVRDAGVALPGADAGLTVTTPPRPERPDDRGTVNVTATAPAVVFIDGKNAGSAPVQGAKVLPGEHVVRVECADAGFEHRVTVPPYADVDVEHRCD